MPHEDAAYQELKSRVDSGRLRIAFIFGPPRSGTTAFERQVHTLCGGINLNHPDLEPEVLKNEQSVWEFVLGKVNTLEEPATAVIKTTSNYISPQGEISLWRGLSEVMFCCFRNPILQIDSFLKLNLDYLLKEKFVRAGRLYDDSFQIKGEPLYYDSSSPPLLNGSYERLGFGFKRAIIQWEYDRPELLDSIWHNFFDELSSNGSVAKLRNGIAESGKGSAHELIECYKKSKPNEFQSLPRILREGLFEWSFGWKGAHKQIADLGNDPNLILVDFTSAQLDPQGFAAKIEGALRGFRTKHVDFDIGVEGDIAFDNARKHHELLPPSKEPLTLDKFPDWMHGPIEQSLAVYMDMLRDNRLVTSFDRNLFMRATRQFKDGDMAKRIDQVDPVYAFCLFADFAAKHPEFAVPRIELICQNHPKMEPYFEMCNRIIKSRQEGRFH